MQKRTDIRWLPVWLILPVLFFAFPLMAKQALDHSVYTEWNRITEQAISRDGEWALWAMSPEEADGELVVRATGGEREFRFERGESGAFSHDSRHVVALVKPSHEASRQARLKNLSDEEKPKNELLLLNLDSGEAQRVERVRSYRLPGESGDWLAWLHGVPEADEAAEEDSGVDAGGNGNGNDNGRADDQTAGTTLVLRSLKDGSEHRFDHVSDYAFSDDGHRLVFTRVSEDGSDDGIFVHDTEAGQTRALKTGFGHYTGLAIDEAGTQVAFLFQARSDEDGEPEGEDHEYSLHLWNAERDRLRGIADSGARFLRDGWHVSRHRQPAFSPDGSRLFFGTAPKPVEIPDHDDKLDDEVVDVDIWHWEDDLLQPMQREQLEQERQRTYLAVAHLADRNRLVQLGREHIPEVQVGREGDAGMALGISNLPYQREISWDFPRYHDAWLIDVNSGEATLVLKAVQSIPSFSPKAGYLHWWDRDARTWLAMNVDSRDTMDMGAAIDHDLEDHTNDRPFAANPYAAALWLEDDSGLIIVDRHDAWRVDPETTEAVNLTGGMGRERGWNFRPVDLLPEDSGIAVTDTLLFTTFDEQGKAHGFFDVALAGDRSPRERVFSDHRYGTPLKAEAADRLLFTRESFQDFPDLWTAGRAFEDLQRLSEANPQQADYRWGTVELVEWESETGKPHQGMLFKPDDFDPDRRYPMIVYFYERASDGLHSHRPPQAHRSVIMPSFYTSNEYIVFVPDVWYREGYPGDSAMESIMPKTRALAEQPWVDEDRVGIQGHSWAGYQIAYMVTKTDFFRAAAGGAPVSNMVSAYGGIRWRTGMSRMFQYERTQSRLGKTLWEDRELYLHNSPIFEADKINTPLLMMHNDHDGAVPWEQGIELFTALRRLERPSWLINYRDEPHWPTTFANRKDWQIRLQQFFDHYLKDEPAPRWLRSGIPALEKGATLGYEKD